MLQYNTWAGFDEGSDMFWTSEETKGWYKAHMQKMVDRVNTVNGKRLCCLNLTTLLLDRQRWAFWHRASRNGGFEPLSHSTDDFAFSLGLILPPVLFDITASGLG